MLVKSLQQHSLQVHSPQSLCSGAVQGHTGGREGEREEGEGEREEGEGEREEGEGERGGGRRNKGRGHKEVTCTCMYVPRTLSHISCPVHRSSP